MVLRMQTTENARAEQAPLPDHVEVLVIGAGFGGAMPGLY